MSELLGSFPVVVAIPVAWGDMDAFQHVNNTVYFRYFESARIAYFERLEFMELMQATGVGPILGKSLRNVEPGPVGGDVAVLPGARDVDHAIARMRHHRRLIV